MKCKDCDHAIKDFFKCAPGKHVCIGVKEPFVINDINVECTQYPENRDSKIDNSKNPEPLKTYVGDDAIYIPISNNTYKVLITKDTFVEAYNKWIKKDLFGTFVGYEDADYWCE